MGYRGKLAERERARQLRAQAWTVNEIVAELGVSKSSVSVWVRDVEFDEPARAARCTFVLVDANSRSLEPVRQALPCGARLEHPSIEAPTRLPSRVLRVLHREIMGRVHALLRCEVSNPG